MRASPRSLARDAVDLLTGRRPEVRNRVKFFLLSPIYDGFYRCLRLDPHHAIEAKLLESLAASTAKLVFKEGTCLEKVPILPILPGPCGASAHRRLRPRTST